MKRQKSNLTRIAEVLPAVRENLGIDKKIKIIALKELWPLVTSFEAARYSEPAYFDKENNLVIAAKNGAIATELSMQKISILKKLKEATKNTDINFKDIRFMNKA